MWFIQIWTSRIMSFSVVVLASILASQIAFIYNVHRTRVNEGREEGRKGETEPCMQNRRIWRLVFGWLRC